MRKTLSRVFFLVFAAIYLLTHFMPRAHAHEGIDHSGGGARDSVEIGDLLITDPFSRATLPNAATGAGYLTIENRSDADDVLVSAVSAVAERTELHEMSLVNDVMQMARLEDGIRIPAGETVTLAPGGLHVMFLGINQAFSEGECVETTLTFETAGSVDICLLIGPTGAAGHGEGAGPAGGGTGHDHH